MSSEVLARYRNGEEMETEAIKIPMIDLPLGATEDRVCGTIDIEKALTEGVKAFEPGLLAKANRGILYVDEVNLLDDHLVDILLALGDVVESKSLEYRSQQELEADEFAGFVLAKLGAPLNQIKSNIASISSDADDSYVPHDPYVSRDSCVPHVPHDSCVLHAYVP